MILKVFSVALVVLFIVKCIDGFNSSSPKNPGSDNNWNEV